MTVHNSTHVISVQSLGLSIANVYAMLLQLSPSNEIPTAMTLAKRILFLSWATFTFMTYAYYTSDLTAKMTSGFSPPAVRYFICVAIIWKDVNLLPMSQ